MNSGKNLGKKAPTYELEDIFKQQHSTLGSQTQVPLTVQNTFIPIAQCFCSSISSTVRSTKYRVLSASDKSETQDTINPKANSFSYKPIKSKPIIYFQNNWWERHRAHTFQKRGVGKEKGIRDFKQVHYLVRIHLNFKTPGKWITASIASWA